MRSVSLILTLILFFTGCQPEDEGPQDYIEVDGLKYELGTSRVIYYDRINDAGELNHFYQIQVFGIDYIIHYDSNRNFFSDQGEDLYIYFTIESKQAITIENTFYQNAIWSARDTTTVNEYSNITVSNFNERRLRGDEQKIDKPIYLAMENRQLEIKAQGITLYDVSSEGDTIIKTVNIHYRGKYF
tara:strand:+ start:39 stop:596 length:558 start_codon:yes stop_codon:yes gene_type:complete